MSNGQSMFYFAAVIIGFITFKIFQSNMKLNRVFHGPKAADITPFIYHDTDSNRYYKFNIKMFVCPPSYSH